MSEQTSPHEGVTGPEPLLDAAGAAELLNVPVSWVRQETRAERIPYIALGSRYKRYDAAELTAWWRQRARGPWRDRGAAAQEARRVA